MDHRDRLRRGHHRSGCGRQGRSRVGQADETRQRGPLRGGGGQPGDNKVAGEPADLVLLVADALRDRRDVGPVGREKHLAPGGRAEY